MSKSLKIVITLIVIVLGSATVGTYLYVATLLDAHELRLTIIKEIEKQLPQAVVELEDLEVELGGTVELKTGEFLIKNKPTLGGEDLFKAQSVSIKLPISSILMGGGNLEVSTFKPEYFFLSKNGVSNWSVAKGEASNGKNAKSIKSNEPSNNEIIVPVFLVNSTVATRFNDFTIHYHKEEKGQKTKDSKVFLEKFIVKNLGLNSNAAFEINSALEYKMNAEEKFTVKAMAIGSLGVKDYLKKGTLEVKSTLRLSDPYFSKYGVTLAMITGDLSAKLESDGRLKVSTRFNQERSHLAWKTDISSRGFFFSDIESEIVFEDNKDLFDKISAPFNLNKAKLNLNGSLELSAKGVLPKLALHLENLRLKDLSDAGQGDLSLEINEPSFTLESTWSIFKGSAVSRLEGKYDFLSAKTIDERFRDISGEFLFSGLDINRKSLRTMKDTFFKKSSKKKTLAPLGIFLLPSGKMYFEFVGNKWADENIEGKLNINFKDKLIKIKSDDFKFSEGSADLVTEIKLYKDQINGEGELKLNQFPTHFINIWLDDEAKTVEGKISGSIKGKAFKKKEKPFEAVGSVNLESLMGEWKNIDVKSGVENIYQRVRDLPLIGEGLKEQNIEASNKFKEIKVVGKFKKDHFNLTQLRYLSEKENLKGKGKGKIFFGDETSEVYFDLIDKYGIVNILDEHLGLKTIPLLFSGQRLSLRTDLDYTIKKVSQSISKGKGKKALKKLINKNIDKFLNSKNKEKVKNFLKGL